MPRIVGNYLLVKCSKVVYDGPAVRWRQARPIPGHWFFASSDFPKQCTVGFSFQARIRKLGSLDPKISRIWTVARSSFAMTARAAFQIDLLSVMNGILTRRDRIFFGRLGRRCLPLFRRWACALARKQESGGPEQHQPNTRKLSACSA